MRLLTYNNGRKGEINTTNLRIDLKNEERRAEKMDITGTAYTITDLMNRYNMTRQGVQQFLTRHLSELNTQGVEHAAKVKGDWIIDSTALERLDNMRGYNDSVVLASEVKQLTKIEELQQQIIELKEAANLMREQHHRETNQLRDKIMELTGQAHNAQLLLTTAESGKQQAEAEKAGLTERLSKAENTLEEIRIENKNLATKNGQLSGILNAMGDKTKEIQDLKNCIAQKENENKMLQEQLKNEQNKSWWQKLFGK